LIRRLVASGNYERGGNRHSRKYQRAAIAQAASGELHAIVVVSAHGKRGALQIVRLDSAIVAFSAGKNAGSATSLAMKSVFSRRLAFFGLFRPTLMEPVM